MNWLDNAEIATVGREYLARSEPVDCCRHSGGDDAERQIGVLLQKYGSAQNVIGLEWFDCEFAIRNRLNERLLRQARADVDPKNVSITTE